jgi:[protein-PII] uridylyltransferase
MMEGRLDVEDRLERRARNVRSVGAAAPPPKVTLVDGASQTATVVEVRAHDEPGLLWRIGRALGDCGLNVTAARVETLGAEAVDVFYVTDSTGGLVNDPDLRKQTVTTVLKSLSPGG